MYSFKKEERLCNVKLIEKLFTDGSSFLVYPFRIVWLSELANPVNPVQVLISVPKKRFKRAVDRNLIKRRIRELYRLNKSEYLFSFLNEHSSGLTLGITYIGNEIGEYPFLEKKFKDALNRFKKLYLSSHVEKDN
ncbi:MAG: ribonuclease P protein component [Sphingobacteriales bacterium 17-39-43]|uniref:ribonuclease P protein component n=1 Tax=Daejeonella sp. TaxID=2805397 RepID=UPI000BC45590|nr:ribonuclease P protein component [Daejeonella sp.]OYX91449.1 MAG: ribonuclease P protein component [Sphingobacteriia bacterium 35-40-5]OYZ29514.1 MAG: ribonuclease P protein component [Sphingobacteriales bacterium 16-39-50]OZA22643.1 MAG: ribonuclease P protein component [Sphingobacteriales bacterium 17-39-43]OZA55500.1 MAG: ribonuclease P protein component [Sphingobacteriales bacterium 39-40-5]HQS52717.1 ribonuclease P protein component [Daejeonella sp.]